ncbi:hypothetical protein KY317_02765 [Candidatus Woesearchaeota archaeon]|nr:hypothetical protein [Candidatus Woesearchaeota archaeon]
MTVLAKPGKGDFDYETVKIDEWIVGQISDVQERLGVDKTFKDKDGELKTKKVDQVRFKFELQGYQFPHYSRWMTLSTNENSNLYKKYISSLFGTKFPADTLMNVEKLEGLFVKTMWDETIMKDGRPFQFISKIRLNDPNDADLIDLIANESEVDDDKPEEENGEEIPFGNEEDSINQKLMTKNQWNVE